jgi:hypothetical protein
MGLMSRALERAEPRTDRSLLKHALSLRTRVTAEIEAAPMVTAASDAEKKKPSIRFFSRSHSIPSRRSVRFFASSPYCPRA